MSSPEYQPPKKRLRKDDEVYLVGKLDHQILGAKLPSNRQVLCTFFYNLRIVKLNVRDSAKLVAEEVAIFYGKARIPLPSNLNCALKVERLYNEWREMQKSSNRRLPSQLQKEKLFTEQLDDLFDMSHNDALQMITNEEVRDFLIAQRQKGRVGCLLGVEQREMVVEQKREQRLQQEEERREKALNASLKNGN